MKFAHLAEKSGNGSISNLSTKAGAGPGTPGLEPWYAAPGWNGGAPGWNGAAPAGDGDDDDAPKPKLDGNGGSTDTYRWVQTLEDLTVSVPVPEGACAGLAA